MERYIINISFKWEGIERPPENIVQPVKTMREAMSYAELIDDTVDKAAIKDRVTGNIKWLKTK